MCVNEKDASRLARKALAAGVRFTPAEIVEMVDSVSKDCMNQMVKTALGDLRFAHCRKKLTQAEEKKVKLSAKNLFKKLMDNRSSLLVVDWYKDDQPRAKVKYEVELSLNNDLPESYDKAAFDSKVSLLMNHFVDMAVQGYGWIGVA